MADFFINRPIFAWVIAILIMMAGLLAVHSLPIAQYPTIALPQVTIRATYPGASAETLANTVTQPIEQKMSGLDHLVYMSSTSESNGTATLTLTFAAGTDPNIAQVQSQNNLQLALPTLPEAVQRQGLQVRKSASSFLMVLGFVSTDGSMRDAEIADYVASHLQDDISRIEGVGDVRLFGSQHSMRIWIDPVTLSNYNLTVADLSAAIGSQNMQVSAGQFGGTPAVPGQRLNANITAQSQLQTPEEFANIFLRVNPDGSRLRLGDVARIEIGQENYDAMSRFNGQPSSGMGIYLATGANALDTAQRLRDYIARMEPFFPAGLSVVSPYDTTPFVRLSIEEVVKTLIEAIILVFLVMLVFLQNLRATLIPTIAVPVVLLGTFGVMAVFGFSINTLTMFGMVLAIGLLVDDAIVVVENVERVMRTEGLPPKEAASKSMQQITAALVGIAMVLSAVFIPMAFFGGSTGVIYRQFSLTLVSAMALSVIVAIILTPALCATMLKPVAHDADNTGKGLGARFNRGFDRMVHHYTGMVAVVIRRKFGFLAVYVLLTVLVGWLFLRIPSAFLPDEDQGILMVQVQLPAGSTQEQTRAVMAKVEKYFMEQETDSVKSIFSVVGFSFSGSGQNTGMGFASLKDWNERKLPGQKAKAVAARAQQAFGAFREAMVFAMIPPAVAELGNANGFDLQLQDQGGLGHAALMQARNLFLAKAMSEPYNKILTDVRPNGKDDTPQMDLVIDRDKSAAMSVRLSDVHDLLQAGWGGVYVNDFIDQGRIKKVYIQADAAARMVPEDLDKWHVRNMLNEMVPLSALITQQWGYGSPRLERYNGLPSVELVGVPLPGVSTGAAMQAVEEIAGSLGDGIGYAWTGISLQEQQSGQQAPLLYALSLLVVFLCLAALYESWAIPFSVLLVVPIGILGVELAALLFGQSNDVYFQVGFLTIVGLSAKNAILIVEFAKEGHEAGASLVDATLEACRLRLRPILMTSLAFILGVFPLAISSGAGSGSQNAIGIGVVGGMISVTVLGVFFIPLFFVAVRLFFSRGHADDRAGNAPAANAEK